ncbi:ABC transporter permease, partial [Acinetobacter baumannii]
PNQFVYGLPPFEMPALKAQLEQKGWKSTPLYPNIRGRLVAKNDQPFADELLKNSNTLKRELNLTQSNRYPQDNVIVQGKAELKQPGEVSV